MIIDASTLKTDLFIHGKWVSGQRANRIQVFNPSTEECIATVADAAVEDALTAVESASKSAETWKQTAPRSRAEILRKAFELLQRDAEHLAHLISLENGKSLNDARGEVAYAAEFFRWYSEEAVRILGDIGHAPINGSRILVQHQPVGVALLITPWNFPAAMATRKIGPALAAGCTCILKPATETPLTAYAIAQLLSEAGVPDGVVNVLSTSTSGPVVDAILSDPRIRKLSFTGSTEVGRLLLRKASESVINCSMELGGNAPFIVFDDADVDKAVEGAMIAKMRNGGEACTAANRFYVQAGIHDEFVQKFSERMSSVVVGAAVSPETQCGPLVNREAVTSVTALVQDAVNKGAKVCVGGEEKEGKGCYFSPTVLTNVPQSSELLHQEIFGPVAPIVSFVTEEEVICAANETEYGLVAYVFTEDLKRGLRVSEKIDAGMVAINRGLVSDPAAPFGGVKQSGLGREGAHIGMMEYLESKYVSVEW